MRIIFLGDVVGKSGCSALEKNLNNNDSNVTNLQNTYHSKKYKIQEVIKPGQVILIQVIKEERGQKGAALTTFISLAGKYTVLMPNTPKGGGISRKIVNSDDRKKIKSILQEIDIPETMGLIVRTAGLNKTQNELTEAIRVSCQEQQKGITTFIEVILNQELGEPFRRDAMKAPVEVAGINSTDMQN